MRWTLLLTCVFVTLLPAQERLTSVELFGAFTTTSKLFPHPNDPDEISRSYFLSVDDIFHAGIELRHTFPDLNLTLGLGTEYIRKTDMIDVPGTPVTIPVRDGFTAVPVELTGYFNLPIGTESFHTYIGGGGGVYFGSRIYEYPGAVAETVDRTMGAGIHVLSGCEYFATQALSFVAEIKFRDVQIESTNMFTRPTTIVGSTIVPLDQTPFDSRLSIDGMTLKCGAAFHF